jgi:polysaccharide pyruvyl transferase WcaK-like protein
MKILIGGVPFGRNNIGDEAILENVVKIIRAAAPSAELTVSTDDPATGALLQVATVPLFGFDVVPYDAKEMAEVMRTHDFYVWAGATGLSDYPDRACELLSAARAAGCRSVIWNVGMNSELNPAKYRLQGRRLTVTQLVDRFTGGLLRWQERQEKTLLLNARRRLQEEISACALVVVRDFPSSVELARCGLPESSIVVGADSAILQESTPWESLPLDPAIREALEEKGRRRVGLCISAQREIAHRGALLAALHDLLSDATVDLVGLPMNPLTDLALLEGLRREVSQPERLHLVRGITAPADMTALAARMDVLVSSRLHLLILGSIHHVPLVGISRGSKVDNYLAPFGLHAVGSVDSRDFRPLVNEVRRLLSLGPDYQAKSAAVREEMLGRLDGARERLAHIFQDTN